MCSRYIAEMLLPITSVPLILPQKYFSTLSTMKPEPTNLLQQRFEVQAIELQ